MANERCHCPFLNRADARCGEHLNIEELSHAFRHCFDRYKGCPVYVELLVERQLRQGEETEQSADKQPPARLAVARGFRHRGTMA